MEEYPHVNAVSGIFVEADDPRSLSDWYQSHLGLTFHHWKERDSYGAELIYDEKPGEPASRISTVYVFEPRHGKGGHGGKGQSRGFKVQLRVPELASLRGRLESKGVEIGETEHLSFGSFARLTDPEGNHVELYQPR